MSRFYHLISEEHGSDSLQVTVSQSSLNSLVTTAESLIAVPSSLALPTPALMPFTLGAVGVPFDLTST